MERLNGTEPSRAALDACKPHDTILLQDDHCSWKSLVAPFLLGAHLYSNLWRQETLDSLRRAAIMGPQKFGRFDLGQIKFLDLQATISTEIELQCNVFVVHNLTYQERNILCSDLDLLLDLDLFLRLRFLGIVLLLPQPACDL